MIGREGGMRFERYRFIAFYASVCAFVARPIRGLIRRKGLCAKTIAPTARRKPLILSRTLSATGTYDAAFRFETAALTAE